MTISIIIPNYNGASLIKKNLPQVFSVVKKYKPQIIIVDDHSVVEDYSELKSFVDDFSQKTNPILLLRNEKNYGFSKTVNRGVAKAENELLVLLNSDVIPELEFLDSVFPKFNADQKLFAVGCMDKSIEGSKTVLRGNGVGSFQRGFLIHSKGDVNNSNTLWVSGGSSIMRTSIYRKLNGLDEIYNPFYWEDIDLSYRAVKSGYTIVFDNKSIVEHRHEEGSIKKNFTKSHVNTIAYRNQCIFMWKNCTDSSVIFSHIVYLPYHILTAVLRLDSAFLKALYLAVLKIPQVIKKRSEQSKLFVLSDQEVIQKSNEKSV
jgi:GT2 family glycosyltransferase